MLTDGEIKCIQIGNVMLKLDLDPPCERSKAVALKELRETEENRQNGLKQLQNLLAAETTLNYPHDERFLIAFLRPCKFYPESAYQLIKRYFTFKEKNADVFKDLLPSKEENTFKHNVIVAFLNRDQFNRRIVVLRLGKTWKHKEVPLDDIYKAAVLYLEGAIMEEETQINGTVVIFDMDGLSLQQTWQFTPSFAKRLLDWLQDSIPLRVKAIHIINQPKIFNIVFQLFKPFLREKLRSRIIFHGTDRDSLHKHISPECLPKEYGGTLKEPLIHGANWHKLFLLMENEYKKLNTYGFNK